MKAYVQKLTFTIVSLALVLCLFTAAYAAKPESYDITTGKGQIWLNGKQLTMSASEKSQPVLSPDHSKILFISRYKDYSTHIGTVDVKTKREKVIKIDQQYPQIMSVEWLTNRKAGAIIHINPSLESYQTYDVISGKNIDNYYGYCFIYNKSKTNILYIEAPPHFSEEKGGYSVMLDKAEIYKTDDKTTLDNCLYPIPDFKRIAFFEYNGPDESVSRSNIVILTMDKNKVKSKKIIRWNKQITKMKWKNENILSIGDIGEYDMVKSKLFMKAS